MIHLHIKGDMHAAFKAADERRIKLTSIQCRYRAVAECFAIVEPHHEPKVRAWYHEDADLIDGYGYPTGTLLHFSIDEQPAVA